jgi:hypothetical protein
MPALRGTISWFQVTPIRQDDLGDGAALPPGRSGTDVGLHQPLRFPLGAPECVSIRRSNDSAVGDHTL